MDLFGRYVFRQTGGAVLLILLPLTGVIWIATALKQLNVLTSHGQNAWTFLKITFLALPNLTASIAPVALLIAVIHVLNRLNSDSELIVMASSGATVWRFGRPLLAIALIAIAALAVVNFYLMPLSLRTFRAAIIEVRSDLISQVLQPGRFFSPESGLTFHIRDRARSGEILGLVMHDERNPKQSLTYLAERGRIIREGRDAFLRLYRGRILRQTPDQDGAQIIKFASYTIDLSRFGPKSERIAYGPRERYLSELINPDPNGFWARMRPGKLRAELHERFSSLLYPIVFVVIALAFQGQAQSSRQGRVKSVIAAFSLAAGARVLGIGAINLVAVNPAAVPLVYAIPVGAITLAGFAATTRMKPRRRTIWQRRLEGGLESIMRGILLPAIEGVGRLWPTRAK